MFTKDNAKEHGKKGGLNGKGPHSHTLKAQEEKKLMIERFREDAQEVYDALFKKAKTGDVPAIKEIFDRVWGKSTQPLANDPDNPIDFGAVLGVSAANLLKELDKHDGSDSSTMVESAESGA